MFMLLGFDVRIECLGFGVQCSVFKISGSGSRAWGFHGRISYLDKTCNLVIEHVTVTGVDKPGPKFR